MKGKLIVIDGTDGTGKGTQTNILFNRLKEENIPVERIDFPQYGKKSASLVESYLNGQYGTIEEVGPYKASIFFATDRYDASFKIKRWLNEGKIVIANRYVTANMGHQGANIPDEKERKKYFSWLDNLEHNIFQIPRPDLNIILHMPAEAAQQLVDKKEAREYITGEKKRDLLEANINHLKNAEKTYLSIAKTYPGFVIIKCCQNNEILSREKIHEKIWEIVSNSINNS